MAGERPTREGFSPERQRIIEQFDRRFSAGAIRRRRLNHLLQSNAWLVWIQILSSLKRLIDFLLGASLLLFLWPLLVALWLAVKLRGGGIRVTERIGRWGCTFGELSFSSGPLPGLPALFNVLKGNLSLIGPRPVSPGEMPASERAAWRRFNVRPGLICLWWIRQRANIAWGSEADTDSEYLDTQSVWGDLAIGLRAIPAAFYGEGVTVAPDLISILGIRFNNLTMDEAVEAILQRAAPDSAGQPKAEPSQVCFVNADCANISCRDLDYKRILSSSPMVLADGIGLKLAGRILNTNIRQNVNGTDLFPRLCGAMAQRGIGLYLLGGKPGVPEDVARWVQANHPSLRVCGFHHGYFTESETPELTQLIRESGASILLVAFGVPKQEKWLRDHLAETGSSVGIGVGGLFDFYSGRIPRAPVWVREIGVEWLYRFIQEPRRMWRRYFVGNFVFLYRVFAERRAARRSTTQSPGAESKALGQSDARSTK